MSTPVMPADTAAQVLNALAAAETHLNLLRRELCSGLSTAAYEIVGHARDEVSEALRYFRTYAVAPVRVEAPQA